MAFIEDKGNYSSQNDVSRNLSSLAQEIICPNEVAIISGRFNEAYVMN